MYGKKLKERVVNNNYTIGNVKYSHTYSIPADKLPEGKTSPRVSKRMTEEELEEFQQQINKVSKNIGVHR